MMTKQDHNKRYYEANKEQLLEKQREYYKKYYLANKEKKLNQCKQTYLNNKEFRNQQQRQHYYDNKAQYITRSHIRKQKIKQHQTPAWADMDAINTIYKQATRKSQIEGRQYHVDHIIPLNGKEVSGLHTADNLQILSASENLSKGNRIYAN